MCKDVWSIIRSMKSIMVHPNQKNTMDKPLYALSCKHP